MKPTIELTQQNLTLMVLGLMLLAGGLYDASPLKMDKAFRVQVGPLLLFLCLGTILFIRRYSAAALKGWVSGSVAAGGKFLPIMVLICIVMALGGVLTRLYAKEMNNLLEKRPRATIIGCTGTMPTATILSEPVEIMWKKPEFQKNIPDFLFLFTAVTMASLPLLGLRTAGFQNLEISYKVYLFGAIAAVPLYFARVPITWLVNIVYDLMLGFGNVFVGMWSDAAGFIGKIFA